MNNAQMLGIWVTTIISLVGATWKISSVATRLEEAAKLVPELNRRVTQIENVVIHRYGSMFPRLKQSELNGKAVKE